MLSAIARSLSWRYPCSFAGVALASGFILPLKSPPFQTSLSVLSPNTTPQVPMSVHTQSTQEVSSIFPFQGDLDIPSMNPLVSLSGSVHCSMVNLYFTANIYL